MCWKSWLKIGHIYTSIKGRSASLAYSPPTQHWSVWPAVAPQLIMGLLSCWPLPLPLMMRQLKVRKKLKGHCLHFKARSWSTKAHMPDLSFYPWDFYHFCSGKWCYEEMPKNLILSNFSNRCHGNKEFLSNRDFLTLPHLYSVTTYGIWSILIGIIAKRLFVHNKAIFALKLCRSI